MTDGDVDVVLSVAGRGDGEQRGDRPALDDLEPIVDQAPFDVLGVAEVRFDPPAQFREPRPMMRREETSGTLRMPVQPNVLLKHEIGRCPERIRTLWGKMAAQREKPGVEQGR